MSAESLLRSVQIARTYMQQKVDDLAEPQLLEVPGGAGNNVLWNVGHIVLSNDRMLYGPSGAATPVPETWENWFKAGSSPADWDETPPVAEVLDQFHTQAARIAEDYKNGTFASFKPLELIPGLTLQSVEDALGFCVLHEGAHIGIVIGLRRQLGALKV